MPDDYVQELVSLAMGQIDNIVSNIPEEAHCPRVDFWTKLRHALAERLTAEFDNYSRRS